MIIFHIFGLETETIYKQSGKVKKSFTGFHHDYLERLEKINVIKLSNKEICPKTGAYIADVAWEGVSQPKTFFPADWTREKVVKKIFEACDNVKKNPILDKNGRWIIEGITSEGLEIDIIMTQKGNIVTAYPSEKMFKRNLR